MNKLGIDIGGTFIKWAIFNKDNKIIKRGKIDSNLDTADNSRDFKDVMSDLIYFINELNKEFKLEYIGFSLPGAIDTKNKKISWSGINTKSASGFNLGHEVEKRTGIRTELINDANAGALGEVHEGAAKGYDDAVVIVIGTGIGSGIVINKEILIGQYFFGGEIGQIPWTDNKPLEQHISAHYFLKKVNSKLNTNMDGVEFFSKLKNDKAIQKYYFEWIDEISKMIVTLNWILDPQIFILGGGVIDNPLFKISDIENSLPKFLDKKLVKNIKIKKAKLGSDAQLYGAVNIIK